MKEILGKMIDGAFTLGKIGLYAGLIGGAVVGLMSSPAVISTYMFAEFGAAAVFAVKGAVMLGLGGLAAGAVGGAGVGIFQTVSKAGSAIMSPPEPAQRSNDIYKSAPSRQQDRDRSVSDEQPGTAFQDRLKQSRRPDSINPYRGL